MWRLSSLLPERRADVRVVRDMVLYFANQLPFADDALLARLYGLAAISPHSSTKAALKTQYGVVMSGPFVGVVLSPQSSTRWVPGHTL